MMCIRYLQEKHIYGKIYTYYVEVGRKERGRETTSPLQ